MQSRWKIMSAMLALVKPLWMWMVLAVLLGVAGFFCSILITVMGTYGLLSLLGLSAPLSLSVLFALLALFGIGRGLLRYGEQAAITISRSACWPSSAIMCSPLCAGSVRPSWKEKERAISSAC